MGKSYEKQQTKPPTSGKHFHVMHTPYTPLLYNKTRVYSGIQFSLILDPRHRLWVLVRTASPRRGSTNEYPQSMF